MIGALRLSCWLLWLAGLLFLGAPAVGQAVVGYAHVSGKVYRLELGPGNDEITWQVAANTELGGVTGAFARNFDGRLFGTSSWWPNDHRLYLIEPSTGVVEFVGPLQSALWVDLAFGHQQRLWMVAGGGLFEVDTSDATTTPVALDRDDLLAVGSYAGTLLGIAGEGLVETYSLIEIDPDSGTSQTLSELEGYSQLGCYGEFPTSMAFDDAGALWVVVAELHGTCIIPYVATGYHYYPDPLSGTPGPRRHLVPGAPSLMPGLAVQGGLATVEIPTLSSTGAIMLAVLILIAGLSKLRRPRLGRSPAAAASGVAAVRPG